MGAAFCTYNDGTVGGTLVRNQYGVRPSFYLLFSIAYVSGNGSASDPIVITD